MVPALSELMCWCASDEHAARIAVALATLDSIEQGVASPGVLARDGACVPRGLPRQRYRVTEESGELCVVREWI